MTTILYSHKHKQIAFDSRVLEMTRIVTDDFMKMTEREGVKFFFAGAVSDVDALVQLYFAPDSGIPVLRAQAIVVDEGRVYVTEHSGSTLDTVELTYSDAIGSGSPWALAAVDFGASPRGAIAYAKKKDSATGGRIRIYNLK